MKITSLFFSLAIFLGCIYIPKDVAILSIDVAEVQKETSAALVESIDDELKEITDDETKQYLLDLKERLIYLDRANNALMRSMTEQLTPEELAAVIKERTKLKERK